jgi:hypothetical protein
LRLVSDADKRLCFAVLELTVRKLKGGKSTPKTLMNPTEEYQRIIAAIFRVDPEDLK